MTRDVGQRLALLFVVICLGCAPPPTKPISDVSEEATAPAESAPVEIAPAEPTADAVIEDSPGEKAADAPLLQLTPRAAEHVRSLIAKEPAKDKLRISLVEKFGGDVHWSVSLTNKVDPFDDVTCTSHGITIVVDQASQKRVAGTKVDFEENVFRFQSPQLQTAR